MATAPASEYQPISRDLVEISQNVSALPDIDIRQQLQQMIDVMMAMQQDIADIRLSINRFDAYTALQPMRSYNVAAGLEAPIQYPSGVVLPPNAPTTPHGLYKMSSLVCQAVAGSLGLPVLPPATPLQLQRQQIIDFLGCGLLADDHDFEED